MLDLETTGVDITKDRVVEIAAAHAHEDFRMKGERELSKVIANEKIKSLLPKNFKFKELYSSWE